MDLSASCKRTCSSSAEGIENEPSHAIGQNRVHLIKNHYRSEENACNTHTHLASASGAYSTTTAVRRGMLDGPYPPTGAWSSTSLDPNRHDSPASSAFAHREEHSIWIDRYVPVHHLPPFPVPLYSAPTHTSPHLTYQKILDYSLTAKSSFFQPSTKASGYCAFPQLYVGSHEEFTICPTSTVLFFPLLPSCSGKQIRRLYSKQKRALLLILSVCPQHETPPVPVIMYAVLPHASIRPPHGTQQEVVRRTHAW